MVESYFRVPVTEAALAIECAIDKLKSARRQLDRDDDRVCCVDCALVALARELNDLRGLARTTRTTVFADYL